MRRRSWRPASSDRNARAVTSPCSYLPSSTDSTGSATQRQVSRVPTASSQPSPTWPTPSASSSMPWEWATPTRWRRSATRCMSGPRTSSSCVRTVGARPCRTHWISLTAPVGRRGCRSASPGFGQAQRGRPAQVAAASQRSLRARPAAPGLEEPIRRKPSAVLWVRVVEPAPGVLLRPLVPVRGHASRISQHAREVKQVPRHERGVAVGEVVVGVLTRDFDELARYECSCSRGGRVGRRAPLK